MLSWLTEITVRRTVSIVPSSAQKCVDNFPSSLLWAFLKRTDSLLEKLDVRFFRTFFNRHQFSDSIPFSLWFTIVRRISLLFWSRSEGWPSSWWKSSRIIRNTRMTLDSHSCSFSLDPHEMSLNIDMKMIRPVKSSGLSLFSDMNSWTWLQSCNVVNPWKYFTRIPLTLHQLCPKFCIKMNFWITSTCLPG